MRERCQNPSCGSSDGVQVNDWGTHCHACGENTFSRSWFKSAPKEERQSLEGFKWYSGRSKEIEKFLSKYYMTRELMDKYHIGSCTPERYVIPYYQDNNLIMIQTRWIDGTEPRDWIGGQRVLFKTFEGHVPLAVVCEDAISAMRIGEHLPAVALLSTAGDLKGLLDCADKLVLWLDFDKAGRQGREKLERSIAFAGKNGGYIESTKDPKWYPPKTIEEALGDIRT